MKNYIKKHIYNEQNQRLIIIFIPYIASLTIGILLYSLLLVFIYILPLQNNLQELIQERYLWFLSVQTRVLNTDVFHSMQKEVSQAQVIGKFHSLLLFNNTFEEEVSWQSKSNEPEFDPISQKQNFLLNSSLDQDAYCNLWQQCNQDQQCINDIGPYVFYNNQSSYMTYKRFQIGGWMSPLTNQWNDLNIEQKQYTIQTMFAHQITKSIQVNQQYDLIKSLKFYYCREKDGIFNSLVSNVLSVSSIINNSKFGGPFQQCIKQPDGHYQKYLFTNPSQFGGFQYMTQSGAVCGNATVPCSCQYYNTPRLFPIEWRCRPWYIMGKYYQKISISQPYIDIVLQTTLATLTYKIEKYDSLTKQNSTYAIFGIDFDFKPLQNKFYIDKSISDNSSQQIDQYAYLVAPTIKNFDTGVGYYTQLVLAHPFSSNTQIQNITTLEFQNSTNRLEETNDFLNKTFFLNQTNLQQAGCDNIFKMNEKYQLIISKNKTLYTTLFTPINICFGDFESQHTLTVGYLAIAFSEKKWIQAIQETKDSNQKLFIQFYIIISCCFATTVLVYFALTIKFLKYNFEIPISILNQFIQCAQPLNILKFYKMIESGQIKTQKELKNLIEAIFQVVVGVQQRIQDQYNGQEDKFSDQEIKQYNAAMNAFKTIQHFDGVGLCLNNIARILMMQGKYEDALKYMQKANLLSEKKINELRKQYLDMDFHQFLSLIVQVKQNKNLISIYAGRKFQLANIIYKFCQKQNMEQFKIFQDITHFIEKKEFTKNFELPSYLQNLYSLNLLSESNNESDNNSINLSPCQELLKRSNYYSNKFYIKQKHQKDNIQTPVQIGQLQDSNILLTQAIDLLQEASIVYKECYFNSKFRTLDKSKCMILYEVLCLQLITKCQLLQKKRIAPIKYLLSEIKILLKNCEGNIKNLQLIQFYSVLKQKYYNLKGTYYYILKNYFKSVRSHLKSLEVLQKNEFYNFYDTNDYSNSLIELQNIIQLEQIPLNSQQITLIQEDIIFLKEKAGQNFNNELNFMEIFFQQEEDIANSNKC
ncbi:tetratricopeptide repeat protein (macronuclear) [Tetrahymena thermophila SB210]|uniref:Tetratricopeptide repeat protein n=1 Tax=Tetrahymena thermophila (strain SB210) TaxID=312017 RepID=I7M9B2_TETTS|nr:tetratricopeptide repeat protein [Tetrahymena thermophila SB210]EAS01255.2 tetratricopeptide repeat protein [Tetrahymena thermophila SB210]|eukprot:XP_001021500.2 tetratricopeptide repeat protein [Tetrahymena thermophila SB210]